MKENKNNSSYLKSYEEEKDRFNKIDIKRKKRKYFNSLKSKNFFKLNKIKLKRISQRLKKISFIIFLFIKFIIIFIIIFKTLKKEKKKLSLKF